MGNDKSDIITPRACSYALLGKREVRCGDLSDSMASSHGAARRARGANHNSLTSKGDMPAYRRFSTRHVDFCVEEGEAVPSFYICDYGPWCKLDGVADADAAQRGPATYASRVRAPAVQPQNALFQLHFDDELNTERLDVLREPERLVDEKRRETLAEYVRHTLRLGEMPPAQRTRPLHRASPGSQRIRNEPRAEWMYRAVLLAALRGAHEAPSAAYLTYAALSPFHERTMDEIRTLVSARGGSFVPFGQVASALAWLAERGLVRLVPLMALSMYNAMVARHEYDYGLTQRVRTLLARPFALAPGTGIVGESCYIASQRSNLRRTVNRFRMERIGEHLARQANSESSNNVLSQIRPLTEYAVLLDVLRVHGIGSPVTADTKPSVRSDPHGLPVSHDANAASLSCASLGGTEVSRAQPPRHVSNLVATCSCLDGPWLVPVSPRPGAPISVRSRSNSSSSGSQSGSAASTPRMTNPWDVYSGVNWTDSLSDDETNVGTEDPLPLLDALSMSMFPGIKEEDDNSEACSNTSAPAEDIVLSTS